MTIVLRASSDIKYFPAKYKILGFMNEISDKGNVHIAVLGIILEILMSK